MPTIRTEVTQVLEGMQVLPRAVRQHVLMRLSLIEKAIDAGLMETGTTTLEFEDLGNERVVLTLAVRNHCAHLDISTSEESVVVSNGYDFMTNSEGSTYTIVDPDLTYAKVDQEGRYVDHLTTNFRLAEIRRARQLMRTLPMFRNMPEL